MTDEDYQKVRDYALKLLSFRPRSIKEITEKLLYFSSKRHISSKLIEKLLEELIDSNFLNDEDFAKWWLEQRQTFRPKGYFALQSELLQKGITRDIIEKVIKKNEREGQGEFNIALKIAQKKFSFLSKKSKEEQKKKISEFLARRGFSWEIIYKVVDSLLKKT